MTRGGRIAALGAMVAVAIAVVLRRHDRVTSAHDRPSPATEANATAARTAIALTASPTPPARAPAATPQRPATEDEYMHELTQLESTDKEGALALARRGEGWYSSSGKAAEARKAMIVTLLADLNRMDEARELARAFMAAFPGSEYLPLVQGATGIHPRPHGPNGIVY